MSTSPGRQKSRQICKVRGGDPLFHGQCLGYFLLTSGCLRELLWHPCSNHARRDAVSKNIVFNELFIDWDSDLTIVEGVFDAIVAGNAIPILGSTISEKSKVFKEIVKNDTPIYLALDADAEKKALFLTKQLLEYGVELYKVEIDPFSDVGEMSKIEFEKRKKFTRKEKAYLWYGRFKR